MSGEEVQDLELKLDAVFEEQKALVRASSSPVTQFVLGTAPYTGGVASLLSEQARKRQEHRLRAFLLQLARDIESRWESLRSDLDADFVRSDQFAALLEDVLQEAGRSSDETKLRYLGDYVMNAARQIRPDVDWRELFRGYLSRLSGTHLRCLRYVYERQKDVDFQDRFGRVQTDRVPVLVKTIVDTDPFIRLRLARICFADLGHLGLLVDWRGLGNDVPPESAYSITENGLQFMRFLVGEWTRRDTEG